MKSTQKHPPGGSKQMHPFTEILGWKKSNQNLPGIAKWQRRSSREIVFEKGWVTFCKREKKKYSAFFLGTWSMCNRRVQIIPLHPFIVQKLGLPWAPLAQNTRQGQSPVEISVEEIRKHQQSRYQHLGGSRDDQHKSTQGMPGWNSSAPNQAVLSPTWKGSGYQESGRVLMWYNGFYIIDNSVSQIR